jgi:hypothetical protein
MMAMAQRLEFGQQVLDIALRQRIDGIRSALGHPRALPSSLLAGMDGDPLKKKAASG